MAVLPISLSLAVNVAAVPGVPSIFLNLRSFGSAVLAAHTLEVGFCDKNGDGFFRVQPNEQLERWQTPYDNGTHLVIKWKSDRRVSGRNVTSYYVNAATSIPILNLFVGTFGGFPQDICAPGGSKARNAVNVEGSAGTCAHSALGPGP